MDSGERRAGELGTPKMMRVYVGATLALLLIAALSYLMVPTGSGIEMCRRLILQNSRYACTEGVAVSTLNASACGGMPSAYSDPCYLRIAQAMNDSALCQMLSSTAQSYACAEGIYIAEGDYSACGGIGQPYSGRCREAIAERLGNQSMCVSIGNATATEMCVSEIGISKMLSSGNVSYCGGVTGLYDKNLTGQIISNFSYASGGAYANITLGFGTLSFLPGSTFSARDFCYALAASRLSESALCLNIADSEARGLCNASAGARARTNATFNYTDSIAACAMAGNGAQVCEQAATLAQAIKTRNASMCGTLGPLFSVGCYSSLASVYKNSSYCSYIANATERGSCVSNA